ncbi:c-type cytochrome [Persephonella sp. KM09-Lau-8]|uniref:c-type cytochrome n=1 Tax=Persephonella sp. KM09-Lau-8 TaxID=1158345 RepID=UPI0004982CB1|nr:c-type cytochrome [Persephonella sp. KM09-Lau-8]
MKKFLSALAAVGLIASAASAGDLAQQVEKLAKEYGCGGCHAVDKVVAGPPYRVIAKEYKGKPNAKETLVKSILGGSMMKWQNLGKKYGIKVKMAYMPAQHGVNKEKAEKIVDLILKLDTK